MSTESEMLYQSGEEILQIFILLTLNSCIAYRVTTVRQMNDTKVVSNILGKIDILFYLETSDKIPYN